MQIKSDKQFNILPPYKALQKYVLSYNIVFPEQNMFASHYTLMPNACGTLSFAFDGSTVLAELWGSSTSPVLLGEEPNSYHVLFLIQLSPYGLYQITQQSQVAFTDKRIPLAEIDRELFELLFNAFVKSDTVSDLVLACDEALFSRMQRQIISPALLLATDTILHCNGQIQVKEIARQTVYSERQLNRIFLSQVGMNVKHYIRLVRFNYVLQKIHKTACCFATLSQQAGYFDQSHFDKDFKAISGITPHDYVQNMSVFYYDAAEALDIL